MEILAHNPDLEREQIRRVQRVRSGRDGGAVEAALRRLEETARAQENVMYPLKEALAAYATIGEVSDALRRVFGTYTPALQV
jgi:methylmalonyl-CoA mutase N-terminal domain/subunit